MPWPLGEASAVRRVGVAAAHKQEWCTREDLNLHAVRRPLLRRLRLPFRHECIDAAWCWLEDSNLPPLAYEVSALPDELSQHGVGAGFTFRSDGSLWLKVLRSEAILLGKLTKGSRRHSRCGSERA
jgi:hypothetical protein